AAWSPRMRVSSSSVAADLVRWMRMLFPDLWSYDRGVEVFALRELCNHLVAEDADVRDFNLDGIARAHPQGRLPVGAVAARRACDDDIGRCETADRRDVGDQLGDRRDEKIGGRVLHDRAVEPGLQCEF